MKKQLPHSPSEREAGFFNNNPAFHSSHKSFPWQGKVDPAANGGWRRKGSGMGDGRILSQGKSFTFHDNDGMGGSNRPPRRPEPANYSGLFVVDFLKKLDFFIPPATVSLRSRNGATCFFGGKKACKKPFVC